MFLTSGPTKLYIAGVEVPFLQLLIENQGQGNLKRIFGPSLFLKEGLEFTPRKFNDTNNLGEPRYYTPRGPFRNRDHSVFAPIRPARRSSGNSKFYDGPRVEGRRRPDPALLARAARRG